MRRLARWLDRHPLLAIMFGAALIATISGGAVTVGRALDAGSPPADLAPGSAKLTTEQLATLQSAGGPFEDRLYLWCSYIDLGELDLRSLPRAEPLESLDQPLTSLAAAVEASPVIIQVRVRAWWMDGCEVFALLDVERALGTSDRLVGIWLGMQIVPGRDWSEAHLLESPAIHTYLPGDEVILFLRENDGEIAIPRGTLYPALAFTSSYRVRDGRIEALQRNPFAAEVDGTTDDQFWADLESIKRQ